MLKNVLKWLTIIFQSISIGALILYGYAMFKYRATWEVLDLRIKNNVRMYLMIGLISLGIFILIKIIEFILYKPKKEKQVEERVEDQVKKEETIYVAPAVEYQHDEVIQPVQIQEQQQFIPKDRQAICPNCNSVVDKDAYICLMCGILLNKIDEIQTKQEKVIYKEIVVNKDSSTKNMFVSVVVVVLIVLMMFVGYDYSKNNGVFFNSEMSQLEKKQYVYSLATEVLTDFEDSIKDRRIILSKNNSYFSLSELGYTSFEYNPTKSYVAVNERDKEFYIILQGQGEYEDYYIDATMKNNLDASDVKVNASNKTVPNSSGTLFIGSQIFHKSE